MKVIILTGEPFPNGMAAVSRIKCYARAFKEGGVEVEVVIWHRTERYGVKPKNIEGKGSFNGIPFSYIGGTPLRGSNVLIRRFNDFRDKKNTERFLLRQLNKGDVVLFYINNFDLETCFLRAAHKAGAFCLRELCELPYGTGAETERAKRMRKKTLEFLFPQFNGIISISDALMKLAKKYTSESCHLIKVPIMVDFEHFSIYERPISSDVPYIFHAGTLYQQKDGILGMIEAFGMAKQRLGYPIKYFLSGKIDESPHANEIRELITLYHLEDSIVFVGYLNREQVKEYLSKASLVISNRPKSQQDYYGFSTKVGEYLASGTPLITTYWGEAVNWLKDGEDAYIIEPENTEALADAICRAFSQPEEAKRIGEAGRSICRLYFDYRSWSAPLINYIKNLQ